MEKDPYLQEFVDKRIENEYWIDRYGKIHKAKQEWVNFNTCSMHSEIAYKIVPASIEHKERYLRQLGWVVVGSVVYKQPTCDKKPTQSQINILDKLGLLDTLLVLNEFYQYELWKK